ncbi:MAG: cellobiose phosphorylase [Candidatus Omnitrophica bacterium]|nr:cellobiose phosphorylase [Candidatus Omnitrophota bacterium]
MLKQYRLCDDGSFVIEDYQHQKVFSNFFPGVAGLWGIPMWAFYVNRGQAMSSFGIESKDKAILEFQPANRAYRLTSLQGFRTFLKILDGRRQKFYEPFANSLGSPYKISQRMTIKSHDLTIEDVNQTLGLKIQVNYFTLPQEPFAALVRRVTLENISKKEIHLEVMDGLPAINPYGLKDWLGKHMSRTVEAWMEVRNLSKKAPFYQLKAEVADTPQVTPIQEGHFYFAFEESSHQLLDMIVEAACIFGQSSDFLVPEAFMVSPKFELSALQQTSNRTPCAFSFSRLSLKSQQSYTWTAMAGFAHDLMELNSVVKKSLRKGYTDEKAQQNREIIDDIKGYCFTRSSSKAFDEYCGQNFLDNILRGGLPISLSTAKGAVSFNVYSRKHGDLERDYNFFNLAPTFLSQGNGNYRDVNQNRRHDGWFNRDVVDSAIVNFMNLIQADGYNPLVVKGSAFDISDESAMEGVIKEFVISDDAPPVKELLKKGFMPGDLLKLVIRRGLIKGNPKDFLAKVLSFSQKREQADFGEGFWSDHWTYNLDLMESYLSLYPEKLQDILIEKNVFSFHLSETYVLPRHKRYVLTDRGVRQYHALAEHDREVKAKEKGYQLRVKAGGGDVYQTNLLVKIICLLANKAASLDPSGIGIEMEANKPNWYDALNGLPGLLGSSICETFELKRWALFVQNSLDELKKAPEQKVEVFEELADFLTGLTHLLSTEKDSLKYWQKANDLKELYRQNVRYGISGSQKTMTIAELKKFLEVTIARVNAAVSKARYDNGLFASYFYHEVSEYEILDKAHQGGHHVKPLKFQRHDLPLFLEGFVHALRVGDDIQARGLFRALKKSPLYDRKLGMYKVNADLSKETEEIGRARVFPSGWLENESVWLHMEYKYFLELLRHGLTGEFFEEIKTSLVPFLDPACYGRSILENSSFIVSSAHEDKNLWGQGFVARLSGSTAEFLHIWLMMNVGLKPFAVKDGQLTLTFAPLLAGWLFSVQEKGDLPANTYAFKFLAKTLVVYHNPLRQDTFGPKAAVASKMILTYPDKRPKLEQTGSVITGALAQDVRQGRLQRIDIILE